MAFTFKGGLHIRDHKELTNSCEIKPLLPCDTHIFPLIQHIGAPLEVKVAVGDTVKVGQVLADADSFMAVPVHSSVSGKVTAVKNHIHPSGRKVMSVFVENDNLYTPIHEPIPVCDNFNDLSRDEFLKIIRDTGLVGLGGAGFPTHVKLSAKDKISFLIINGAECEPYITADHSCMLAHTQNIIDGLKAVMNILELKESYIGIETNKTDCINAFNRLLRYDKSIHIMPLKPKYPQGAEKMLIKAISGRTVPSGGLPSDVGAMVMNIATLYAIGRVLETSLPLTERIVTVSGDDVNTPSDFLVPLGVPFSFLFEAAGGFIESPEKIICGGPMMGIAQYSLDAPVIKTTSSLLAFKKAAKVYDPDSPCIRCGSCVSHCPMHLMPYKLSTFALNNDAESAEKYHIVDCIQCGMCSYICPAKRNLLSNIMNMRPVVMNAIRERKKAVTK